MIEFTLYLLIIYIVKINYLLLDPKYLTIFMVLTYWIVGIFDIIIRKKDWLKKYKLKKYRKENITEFKIIPNVLLNFFYSYIYFNHIYQNITSRGLMLTKTEPTFLNTLFELLIVFLIYDLFFYTGHYFLHFPSIYKYHKKHHSVNGTIGISAIYMDKLDFLLEVVLPFTACFYISNCNLVTSYCLGIIGSINTVTTHMIYDLPFIPYSPEHFTHHLELKNNYGILIMDNLFGTKVKRKYT